MSHHGSDDIINSLRGLNSNLDDQSGVEDLFRKLVDNRAKMGPLGATGAFPEGKLIEEDEGEICIGITADKKAGKVLIDFGKPVAWMGMNPNQARELGITLCRNADIVDGKRTRVSFGEDD